MMASDDINMTDETGYVSKQHRGRSGSIFLQKNNRPSGYAQLCGNIEAVTVLTIGICLYNKTTMQIIQESNVSLLNHSACSLLWMDG